MSNKDKVLKLMHKPDYVPEHGPIDPHDYDPRRPFDPHDYEPEHPIHPFDPHEHHHHHDDLYFIEGSYVDIVNTANKDPHTLYFGKSKKSNLLAGIFLGDLELTSKIRDIQISPVKGGVSLSIKYINDEGKLISLKTLVASAVNVDKLHKEVDAFNSIILSSVDKIDKRLLKVEETLVDNTDKFNEIDASITELRNKDTSLYNSIIYVKNLVNGNTKKIDLLNTSLNNSVDTLNLKINLLDSSVDKRLNEMNSSIRNSINYLKGKVDENKNAIKTLDSSVDKRLNEMNSSIRNSIDYLKNKTDLNTNAIKTLDSSVDKRFNSLDTSIDKRLNEMNSSIRNSIDYLKNKTDLNTNAIKTLDSSVDKRFTNVDTEIDNIDSSINEINDFLKTVVTDVSLSKTEASSANINTTYQLVVNGKEVPEKIEIADMSLKTITYDESNNQINAAVVKNNGINLGRIVSLKMNGYDDHIRKVIATDIDSSIADSSDVNIHNIIQKSITSIIEKTITDNSSSNKVMEYIEEKMNTDSSLNERVIIVENQLRWENAWEDL